ncbi:hypothetical protein F2Q69_00006728 [Brassica cretica]|uniref:Uncharacterized protein n=1 Tax=Brassica cretica TaxID=69181 RepID=A0A8S9P2E8_BRACR|nr:hypothetical protein F2Q69_00006728 [Brassica cretica]
MLSRRWDPGICVGDWLITEVQDRDPDGWKQGFHSDQLGIDLGFNKEILGSLRKCKIWIDWCWAPIIIKTESSNYKGCTLDCDFLILFLFIVEIVRNTQRFGVIGAWRLWRESREENGGSSDRAKHDDRARSYKGMVINGNMRQQNKERDGREYYGKGKGKMFEAPDSKWVKVAERGHRRPSNNHGNYRGDSEGSLYKSARREDARNGTSELGFGGQEAHNRTSSGQSRADEGQRAPPKEDREEREIKNNGEDDTMLPSTEFQLELAKTQAEGTEVTVESTDEEKVLLMVSGMVEKQDDIAEDLEMEIEAINATLMESGVDMEEEEELQTLLQEEAEQASRAREVRVHTQEEEEMVCGEADIEKDTGAGVLETRQGNRKRLFKPSLSTAGSTKMRLASALLSPSKRASAKMGPRHGDSRKPLESKGSLNPKLANLKF